MDSRWHDPELTYLDWVRLALEVPAVLMSNLRLTTALVLLIAALLGLFVSPLWFSIHLIDVVNKSSDLQYVFRSVTTHSSAILWTAFFGVLIIYIYAAIGHGLLPGNAFSEAPHMSSPAGLKSGFGDAPEDGADLLLEEESDTGRSKKGRLLKEAA